MTFILVVEDDEPTNFLIKRILERANYTVKSVFNAHEALEIALESPPLLAIVDIRLPHTDGFSFIEELKSYPALQDVPTLALTADVNNEAREKAEAIGCNLFMGKPFSSNDLIAVVEQLITQTEPK